jgi:hypothetical protein
MEHLLEQAALDDEQRRMAGQLTEAIRGVTFETPTNAEDYAIAYAIPLLQMARLAVRSADGDAESLRRAGQIVSAVGAYFSGVGSALAEGQPLPEEG